MVPSEAIAHEGEPSKILQSTCVQYELYDTPYKPITLLWE